MKSSHFSTVFGIAIFLCLTCILADSKKPETADRKVLFDFMKSTEEISAMVQQWKTIEWTVGKNNRPVFEPHPEGGVRLELQPKNFNTGEYEAPNVQFDFDTPQDWSHYNFLVIRLLNPTSETNYLRVDLYCPENYAVQVCPIPPGDWYDLRIPMSRFVNYRNPLNPHKVTAIALLQRDLTRLIPFRIASICLEEVVPPLQRTEFPGLQAWFFPGNDTISKTGFHTISADDPKWESGKAEITTDSDFASASWDALWKGHATGKELTILKLPVPRPGKYQAAVIFRGKNKSLTDTFVKLGDSPFYRHIIASSYAEMRILSTTTDDLNIPLTIKQGRPDANWSISAVMLYPEESAEEILEQFVFPCLDDMMVTIREDRILIADETPVPDMETAAYDIYSDGFKDKLECAGNELFFAITPKTCIPHVTMTLDNIRDEKGNALPLNAVNLKSIMEYTATSGNGYKRLPRFCKLMFEHEVTFRNALPNWFLIEGTGLEGIIRGDIVMDTGTSIKRIPFQICARGKLIANPDMFYFLWYYPSNGDQEYREFSLLRDYGFNSIELPILNGRISQNPDGTFAYDMSPMIEYMRRYMKRSGLKGPMPMYLYNPLRTINNMLENKTFISSGPNLQRSIDAITELVRITEELRQKEGWPEFLYYAFDEIQNTEMAKAYHKAIRNLGVKVFTTSVGIYGSAALPSTDDEIDVYCYPNYPPQDRDAVKKAIKKQGKKYWGYSVDSGNPLATRFNWGVKLWHLGMTGYGCWHFGGSAMPSTLIGGGYRYGVAFYGPGRMMTTPSLFAIAQGMEDYNALKALENTIPDSALLKRFHEIAEKLLPCIPAELSTWYQEEGEAMFNELHKK